MGCWRLAQRAWTWSGRRRSAWGKILRSARNNLRPEDGKRERVGRAHREPGPVLHRLLLCLLLTGPVLAQDYPRITVSAEGIVRVQTGPRPPSLVVKPLRPATHPRVRVEVAPDGRVRILDRDGTVILEDRTPPSQDRITKRSSLADH